MEIRITDILDVMEILEEDFYTKDALTSYVDNDELSPVEEGFMLGYLNA